MKIGQLYRRKVVELLEKELKEDRNMVFIGLEKVNAVQMNSLRKQLRHSNAKLLVSKNSLIKLAAKK